MDWKSLGQEIADFAPALGTALGGPVGAAVGALVASVFGTANDPDQISAAIKADPQAAMKLRELELTHQTEIAKLILQDQADERAANRAQIADINTTIRAELTATSGYRAGWRPAFGYAAALTWVVQVVGVVYAIIATPTQAAAIVNAIVALTPLWGIVLAVLGISVQQRSKDKQVSAGLSPTGILGQLLQKRSK